MPKWSLEQERAINTANQSLLVSAAAGSGKTATLTQRCVDLTCKAAKCKITEMLVVTYTEAAAAEMKGRIGDAMRELEAAGPSPAVAARIWEQLALLPASHISTLHAFCARLIRRYFQYAGLDPDFSVLDEAESLLMKQEVIAELFEAQFQAKTADRFTRLIDLYADANVPSIEQAVIRTHDVLRSLPDAEAWRKEALDVLNEVEEDKPFLKTRIGARYQAMVVRRLSDALLHANASITVLERIDGAQPYVTIAGAVAERLQSLIKLAKAGDWDEAKRLADGKWDRRGNADECADPQLAESIIKKLKELCAKLSDFFACGLSSWRSDMIRTIPHANAFLSLVADFGREYDKAKRAAHALDFSDLEHIALELLRKNESVTADCRKRFVYVMVDEFQDVNRVQWEIICRLCMPDEAGRPANLFCVGDVKQSIYRFRMADPTIFMEQEQKAHERGELLPMQHNFRSRTPLLDAINFVFGELMKSKAATEIVYADSHQLHGKRLFPEADHTLAGAPVELHILQEGAAEEDGDDELEKESAEDLDRVEREARYIAKWVEDLMKQGRQILDKGGKYRPLGYGDIAILLRSARFSAIEYSRALAERNIPCFAESRTGFFTAVETNDLISILSLLDNEQQDIPWAAILRNPVFGMPSPEASMLKIRLAYPKQAFHLAVQLYAVEKTDGIAAKLRELKQRLRAWREESQMNNVADLLWQIISETSYLAFCRSLVNGRQRLANVLYLHRCARRFCNFQHQGLYRFMQFLRELQEATDLGQPSPGEAGNAVQIMTVHGSKGLEFPVVILSDIGKKFNTSDSKGNILVDREDHLALCVADETAFVRYPSAASLLVKERINTASRAEELRVLYVAMTRAQECLLLVGSASNETVKYLKRQMSPGVDPEVFRAANCYLRWLVPLTGIKGASAHLKVVAVDEASIHKIRPEPPAEVPATAHAFTNRWEKAISRSYKHSAATLARAATSVTGLSKHEETPTAFEFDAPESASTAGGDARQRGIVVHRFMELLDLSAPTTALKDQLAAMDLVPAEAAMIDLEQVRWFLDEHAIGQLLRAHADSTVRELPIIDSVAAAGIPSDDGMDRMLLRGRIDAVVETPEGLHIIDYKTDARYPEPGSTREQNYKTQMGLYRETIQRSGMGKVVGVHLVFLAARRVLTV